MINIKVTLRTQDDGIEKVTVAEYNDKGITKYVVAGLMLGGMTAGIIKLIKKTK